MRVARADWGKVFGMFSLLGPISDFWLCTGEVTGETIGIYPNCSPNPNRVQNLLSGRTPGGAGEGQTPDLVKKEVQRILGHIQATPRPFLLR